MERTAGGSDKRARGLTAEPDSMQGWIATHLGYRIEEGSGIGVMGIGEYFAGHPDLHDLAEVHHGDAVTDVANGRKVVRDHEQADSEPIAQICEQLQNRRLHGHVERGDWFSATMTSGSTARARAIAIRWRCPPENAPG